MRAVIYANHAEHQRTHAAWLSEGMKRHGVDVVAGVWDKAERADLHVIWGWHQRNVIRAARGRGAPILVMERGHIQPRMQWVSCGFNGLARRGVYPSVQDDGERWADNFAHHLQPWNPVGDYALVMGQVPGDAALGNLDIQQWAQRVTSSLRDAGYKVRFRPHPNTVVAGSVRQAPAGAAVSFDSLSNDLAGAFVVVTYNSTSGVEAILAGKPTITMDAGAMAWPVAGHHLNADQIVTPDRTDWCHALAWTQWLPHELQDGTAWSVLRETMKGL